MTRLGETGRLAGGLIERIIERDGAGMRMQGDQLLGRLPKEADRRLLAFALDAAMLGAIVTGDAAYAKTLWQRHGGQRTGSAIPIENRLMLSVAEVRMNKR